MIINKKRKSFSKSSMGDRVFYTVNTVILGLLALIVVTSNAIITVRTV